jgi:hypothetical protein
MIAALASLDAAAASAETRGTLRAGMMSLELQSSADTPLFGGQIDRAITRYNAAIAAYDQATGATMQRIDASDLRVAETLFLVAPGIEVGGRHYFFRLEAPLGLAADLRSVGVGLYPINLQAQPGKSLAVYVSAGGTASWLDRPGPGDVGGLVAIRGAAGVRIARRLLVEVGYSAFALGGTVNRDQLESMTVTADAMQHPDHVVAAGEARGLFDVSAGIAF